ncbi:MAG: class I SAM-dependent methyltransferase [Gammaproteobacteria bacterium]|nr:class I SAM-dependent methyltransferase [Gammaproteobacteria bacterium]MDH3449327.1 class I SAM-dependent methyltransferase [Gammaproteobacteria bacterium]
MGKSDEILGRVSHLRDGDSSREIYDDWSDSYDDHLIAEFGYISPAVAARELAAAVAWRDRAIIDFGCGTGLVGEALRQQGFATVDGIDIAEGMLEQAREKGVYRNLVCADLTLEIAVADGIFEAGVCIGSMGAGHVGARHVPGLLRPIRPGGLFVIVMNGKYYDSGGFDRAFAKIEADGLWQIRKLEEFNYMTRLERPGWLLVAEKR